MEIIREQARATGTIHPVRPWVRLFARTIDWFLFGFCAFLLVMLLPLLLAMTLPWLQVPSHEWPTLILVFVGVSILDAVTLLVLAEPLCFALWGSTPGKSLLRVSVKNPDGSRLSFQQTFKRLVGVVFKGEGLYIPFLFVITHWLSYQHLKRHGVTRWDQQGGFVVTHRPIGPVRTALAAGIILPGVVLINGLSTVGEYLLKKL